MTPDTGDILIRFAIATCGVFAFEVGHWLLGLLFSVNVPKVEMCRIYWIVIIVLLCFCYRSALNELSDYSLCVPVALPMAIHLYLNHRYGLQIYRSRPGGESVIRSQREELMGRLRNT